MRFRAQKVLMAAAFLCYAEALAAFALHAAEIAGGAPAFFNAFYGSPSVMTPYAMAGYAGQCLAVFALMLIVNWRAMVGYFSDEPQTKAAKSSETEKKAAPAENPGTREKESAVTPLRPKASRRLLRRAASPNATLKRLFRLTVGHEATV